MQDINLKDPLTLPLIVSYGDVLFPTYRVTLTIKRLISANAVKSSTESFNNLAFFVAQKNVGEANFNLEDLYNVGTICEISNVKFGFTNSIESITINPLNVVDFVNVSYDKKHNVYYGQGVIREIADKNSSEEVALFRKTLEIINESPALNNRIPKSLYAEFSKGTNAHRFCFGIGHSFQLPYADKQSILDSHDTTELLQKCFSLVAKESEIVKIDDKLNVNIKQNTEKAQREYYLREKMRAIRQELGEDEASSDEGILDKLDKNPYPENIKAKIKDELKKAGMMPPGSQEAALIKNYINTLLSLPYFTVTQDLDDLNKVRAILDKNHHGLEKVKDRIIEYLAVKIMTGNLKSPILCLFGPPGVGKTSLAKSIAEALDRKFVKCSLGGISDEAEIRGHRRTYVGSIPGRIINGMKKAGVTNPVFLLDEVDKLAHDYKGDPASALLEVLDPEQNNAFNDNYIEEPYDLSNVLFIATANSLDDIPAPLRDRMELIEMNSYTMVEKMEIAKNHLIPKIMNRNNISEGLITFKDEAIQYIIQRYTMEAGARELERKLEGVVRKILVEFLVKNRKNKRVIDKASVKKYLGIEIFDKTKKDDKAQVGVVTGLAYTSYGGTILQIEVNAFEGKGGLVLTGQLGDVMKESCSIALDFVKSNAKKYKIEPDFFNNHDIHIHVPEGAIPKDGPSAGIAITLAIISCVTGQKVNSDVAMTGEVTLRGLALAIGGLKEKLLAALTSGITTVIVPKANKSNVEDIPTEITEKLSIHYMTKVDDAIEIAFKND